MAIAPTGAIYKSLFFDGEDSRDYGVYITGEAVFNAPERAVEMVSIPGRSGALALDYGRFENIEVTYPAGIFADTEADFAEAISDFRNLLCSKRGYVRLQDEYNPNEYRMATFIAGLEADPTRLDNGYGAEFTLTFNCKPQRYLTSGETSVSVDSGDTLTNPTRFEASPLLEVEGYGNVHIGGYDVNLANTVVGHVSLLDASQGNLESGYRLLILPLKNASLVNQFDEVAIGQIRLTLTLKYLIAIRSVSVTDSNSAFTSTATVGVGLSTYVTIETVLPSSTTVFDVGEFLYKEDTITITAVNSHNETITTTLTYTVDAWIGDPSDSSYFTISKSDLTTSGGRAYEHSSHWLTDGITAESTKDFLGHPTYIDCDIGIAYRIDDGVITSLDGYIDLGSDLPTLASGDNEVTYDNTITDLKIVPRYWKI